MRAAFLAASAIGLSCVVGCSVEAPTAQLDRLAAPSVSALAHPSSSAALGAATVHTVIKEGPTKVSLQSLPNAMCEVSADGAPGTLRVFSDDRGIVSLFGTAKADGDARIFKVTCADDSGTRDVQSFEARVGAAGSDAVLQEAADRQALEALPHPGAKLLPALTADEASQLTEEDVHNLGYPPRGTTDASSKEYRAWLGLVAKPVTVLAPHLTENPGVRHGPTKANASGGSSNWSGLVLNGKTPYGYVFGIFNVLGITGGGNNDSSFWVGLDGWGGNDVVQDGTEQQVQSWWIFSWTSYGSWIEYYPLNEQSTSVSVSPGNQIEAWSWMSNSTGHNGSTVIVQNAGYGWFYLYNASTGNGTGYLSIQTPSGAGAFTGRSVEWILERPDQNGQITTLADYGSATLSNMAALDFSIASHSYATDPFDTLTMYNGGDVLSTVAITSAGSLAFTWHASQ